MPSPTLFVSYSHDSGEHKAWVMMLATHLRANGVDATLDQWDLGPGQDIVAFMHTGIMNSDRVLLICSESYVSKAEAGAGGVGYERLVVTAELVQNIDTKKFIPIVRNNGSDKKIPSFLGPRLYIDFSDDSEFAVKAEELLREIHGTPKAPKPALGRSPFSGELPDDMTPHASAGPSGLSPQGMPILDGDWFHIHTNTAVSGLTKLGLQSHMEIRLGPHEPFRKSQIELLNAVRQSEIHTFGWPIGVTLENREEFRPRPTTDGIIAEVSITDRSLSGYPSYDYWSLRNDGSFYLLQSLFEDSGDKNKIFFNTRIARVTESLLFSANLYQNLGAAPEARFSIRVTHRGLAGRVLGSSNPNRHLMSAVTREQQAQAEIVVVLSEVRFTLVDSVQRILAPMFMLFDYKEFAHSVYEDIVRRFERGEVT